MEDDLFKRKLAYPYRSGQIIEQFYGPLISGGEKIFLNQNSHIQILKKKKETSFGCKK